MKWSSAARRRAVVGAILAALILPLLGAAELSPLARLFQPPSPAPDFHAVVEIPALAAADAKPFERAILGTQLFVLTDAYVDGAGFWDADRDRLPDRLPKALRSGGGEPVFGSLRFLPEWLAWKGALGPREFRDRLPAMRDDLGCRPDHDIPINFGLGEFLKAAIDDLGVEPIVVIGARVASIGAGGEFQMQQKPIQRLRLVGRAWEPCPGAEQPVRIVSSESPAEARRMVAYANARYDERKYPPGAVDCARLRNSESDDPPYWAAVRAQCSGHPAPFGVRYWEIGNEISDTFGEGRGLPPRLYARAFRAYGAAMRSVESWRRDPASGRLEPLAVALGASAHYYQSFGLAGLQHLIDELDAAAPPDFFSVHQYADAGGDLAERSAADLERILHWKLGMPSTSSGDGVVREIRAMIERKFGAKAPQIRLAMTEYNPSYQTGALGSLTTRLLDSDLLAVGVFNNLRTVLDPEYHFSAANIFTLTCYRSKHGASDVSALLNTARETPGVGPPFRNYLTERPNFKLFRLMAAAERDATVLVRRVLSPGFRVERPTDGRILRDAIATPPKARAIRVRLLTDSPQDFGGELQIRNLQAYSEKELAAGAIGAGSPPRKVMFPRREAAVELGVVPVEPAQRYNLRFDVKGDGWRGPRIRRTKLMGGEEAGLSYNNGDFAQSDWRFAWRVESAVGKPAMTRLAGAPCRAAYCAKAEGVAGSLWQKPIFAPMSPAHLPPTPQVVALNSQDLGIDAAIPERRAVFALTVDAKNFGPGTPTAHVAVEYRLPDGRTDLREILQPVGATWEKIELRFNAPKPFAGLRVRLETSEMGAGDMVLFENVECRLEVAEQPRVSVVALDGDGREIGEAAQQELKPYNFGWTEFALADAPDVNAIVMQSPAARKLYVFAANGRADAAAEVQIVTPRGARLRPLSVVELRGRDEAVGDNEAPDRPESSADEAGTDAAPAAQNVELRPRPPSSIRPANDGRWLFRLASHSVARLEFAIESPSGSAP